MDPMAAVHRAPVGVLGGAPVASVVSGMPGYGVVLPVPVLVAPTVASTGVLLPPVPQTLVWPAQTAPSGLPAALGAVAPQLALGVGAVARARGVVPGSDGSAAASARAEALKRVRGVARARWNADEERRLVELTHVHGKKREWQLISELLGSGRTASGVEQHWQVLTGQRARNGATICKADQDPEAAALAASVARGGDARPAGAERRPAARWTADEESALAEAVRALGKGRWCDIAKRLGSGRSPSAVEQHWQIITGQRKSKGSRAQNARAPPDRGLGLGLGLGAAAAGPPESPGDGGAPAPAPALLGGAPADGGAPRPERPGGARWSADENERLARAPGLLRNAFPLAAPPPLLGGASPSLPMGGGEANRHRFFFPRPQASLVVELGARGSWRAIAERLNSGRSAGAVEQHYQILTGGRRAGTGAAAAAAAAAAGDDRPRAAAAKRSVAHRWTPNEEAALRSLVEAHGCRGKWGTIAEKLATGRTSSGVEQHWKIMNGHHPVLESITGKDGRPGIYLPSPLSRSNRTRFP